MQLSIVQAEETVSEEEITIPTVDETNVAYLKADGTGDGTSAENPVGSLEDAFTKLSAGGTTGVVYIVDAYTISTATTPSTMDHVKITSANASSKSTLSISQAALSMQSGLTFENIIIKGAGAGTTLLYASGNHLVATENVESPTTHMLKVYGGGKGVAVENSYVTLNSGNYHFICGAGNGAAVKGNAYLTVGGNVNADLLTNDAWNKYEIGSRFVAGGGVNDKSPVYGDVKMTINDNAAFHFIFAASNNNGTGGSKCNQIKMTINGGYAYCVTGGGRYGATSFDTTKGVGSTEGAGAINMTINGGTFNYVFGAANAWPNKVSTTVTGDVNIDINGGSMNYVFGGGNMNSVTGNITIDVTAGTIANGVYGGGYDDTTKTCFNYVPNSSTAKGNVTGNVAVNITGGTVGGRVCGAGYTSTGTATVTGDVTLKISSTGTFSSQVHGGGYVDGSGTGTATVDGNTNVIIENGTYSAAVFGGGVEDNDGITNVTGTAALTIKNGIFKGKVFGGGFSRNGQANVGSVDMLIENGTFNSAAIVHGGGFSFLHTGSAEVTNTVSLDIAGGTFSANVYGGGMVNSAGKPAVGKVGSVDMNISAGIFNGTVYGAGNQGQVANDVVLNVTGGTFAKLYGGSYQGEVTGNVTMNLTNCESKRVFGGGSAGTIGGDINVTVGKDVNKVLLETCSAHSNHCGWEHHETTYLLIAGGQDNSIAGSINLTVTDNAAFNYVYAGSNSTAKCKEINSTFNGGYVYSIYGGAYFKGVEFHDETGAINMTINDGTFYQVFGGNYYPSPGENDADVTGDVNLNVLGGTIFRRVYGGSYNGVNLTGNDGSSHVIGDITVSIGGGANITLDGNNHSYTDDAGDEKDDTTDLSIYGHSRNKASGDPFSDENSAIIFLDQIAYAKYNGKLGANDTTMKLLMGSTTEADSITTQYASDKYVPISYNIDKYQGDDAYPDQTEYGYVFAGWYADRACTTVLEAVPATGNYYAKFVDKNVLTVKFQKSDSKDGSTDKINLRFVTTVDTLNFDRVGFIVEVGGVQVHNVSSSTVYTQIQGFYKTEEGSTDIIYYEPTEFSPIASKYFMAYEFYNVPLTEFDGDGMTVTPYWITYDGTIVLGEARTIISDGNGSVKAK